jgi:hypothetical protein
MVSAAKHWHHMFFFVVLGALAPTQAAWAAAPVARVFVVPLHEAAGIPFDMGVVRYLQPALAKRAKLVPPATAKLAYRTAGITPAGAKKNYENAQVLGRAAGAHYVLIVEAVGAGPNVVAQTLLVDVRTARAVQSARFKLLGGKFNAAVAGRMVGSLVPKLKATAGHAPLVTTAPKRLAKARPGFAFGGKDTAEAEEPGGSADPTEPGQTPNTAGEKDADGLAVDDAEESVIVHTARRIKDAEARPAARLGLGLLLLQRNGTLQPKVPRADLTPPCYCGTARNANPFFAGGSLQAEVFPYAFYSRGKSFAEGLGLHAELLFSSALSTTDPDNKVTTRSNIVGLKLGGQVRYVLWDSPLAADLQLDVGYGTFAFPLKSGPFPGVSYHAPYVGLVTHAPLGMPELAGLLGGHLAFATRTGDRANDWLGKQMGGTSFNFHAGLRYSLFERFEVTALYRLEIYQSAFLGQTAFPTASAPVGTTVPIQLSDVTLHDTLNELIFSAGVTF